MFRVTQYRTDPRVVRAAGRRSSYDTMRWLRERACASLRSRAGRPSRSMASFKFWGGLTVESWGGGPGLIDQHIASRLSRNGIEIRYEAVRGLSLIYDGHDRDGRPTVKADGHGIDDIECQVGRASPAAASRSNTEMAHPLPGPGLGTRARCAARPSTPATASAWRSLSVRRPSATGRAATPSAGITTRRNSATSPSATTSRSTPIRGASWSTPPAGASSMRARTSATTPTPNTAA